MIEIVLCLAVLILVAVLGNTYIGWINGECPKPIIINDCPQCPQCPECASYPDPNTTLLKQNENLKMMVRYLTLVLKKLEAQKELYKLSHGYHQVYNSPKMEYLKKAIRKMKKEIKSDASTTMFFERNLNNIIE